MDVGMAVVFQATNKELTDHQVYQQDLRLGLLAEELGFQSIWGIEHHFTDYTMCPDPLQFLSYFAAKSEKLLLGTMVIVLPWHDPMRVAEEVSMLDNMSNGRMILGIGRGLGRVEFEGFGRDQNIAREYFTESAQMILEGLESGTCEFNGAHIKQAKRDIRPRPFKSFKGRTYAAAVSPESSELMAKLGVGILIIPQKPWHHVERELVNYRKIYREVNGAEPPAPILAGFTYCDKDAGRAEEMATRYIGGYYRTAIEHYEMASDHLNTMKGYESYAGLNKHIVNDADGSVDFYKNIQVYGTPEQCYEKIKNFTERTGAGAYNAFFNFAGMPIADAEASMRLFAKEVLPEVKKLPGKPLMEVMKEAAE